jgi:hypothetical protein
MMGILPGEDRIRDHCHGFDSRVQGQQITLLAATSEGIDPGIMRHIATVSTKPTELDIVAMAIAAMFEDEDGLVLAAV